MYLATLALGATLLAATAPAASAAPARASRSCKALRASASLRHLSTAIASLAAGPASRRTHRTLARSARVLRHARRHAPKRARSALNHGARRLVRIDRARRLSNANARRLRREFTRLDRRVGRPCHLPALLRRAAPKSADIEPGVAGHAAQYRPRASAAGVDRGLCDFAADDRAAIPSDFVVDACWDGANLVLQNRTSLVQRISGSGIASGSRHDFPPQEWASWIVAHTNADWQVLPPNYGATLAIGDGAASVSVSPAETSLLDLYALTKVLVGYLPYDPALENAVAGLVHSIDDAVAKGRQCMRGANVFKRVGCSAVFTTRMTMAIGAFVIDASIDSFKKNAIKGTLKHAAGVLWGLVQEGKYIYDVALDVFSPGSTHLTIAAAPEPAEPDDPPAPTGTPTPHTTPGPGGGGGAPRTFAEQQGSHGVNTFRNYHNASGMGPRVAAGSWVQVSCKVWDTTIRSVNPDGYWYRIASSPWNNAYYSPANTFMNGDPWGGPFTHNTDFGVPNC
jgi:hypothetical protein